MSGGPPPYMPSPSSPASRTGLDSTPATGPGDRSDDEVARRGEGSTIPGYGKDQEFPGLER